MRREIGVLLSVSAVGLIVALWYVDWALPRVQLGPVAALPFFVLAYQLNSRAALVVAGLAAAAFAAADYDVGSGPERTFDLVVYSLGLFAAFAMLVYAAHRWRRQHHEIATLHADLVRQRDLAEHDPLTGLPNRAHFDRSLDATIAAARPSNLTFGVLIADLDGFKAVNDTHGHLVGDAVLIEVARRFSASVRHTDVVARIGGDEFGLIVSPLASQGDVARLCEKLFAAIAAPMAIGDALLRIGVSFGFSTYDLDGCERPALLQAADKRMYQMKRLAAGVDAAGRERARNATPGAAGAPDLGGLTPAPR